MAGNVVRGKCRAHPGPSPRGHNRRAQQRRQDESQGSLLHRINAATLPLRQRIGQGMSGLGQRGQEAKTGKFKLASPLPRKHTIGAADPDPALVAGAGLGAGRPRAQSRAVRFAGGPHRRTGAGPHRRQRHRRQCTGRSQTGRREGGWHLAAARCASRRDPLPIFRKFELPGAELSRLIAIEGPDRPLTRLQSGRAVFILIDDTRRIQRVEIRSTVRPSTATTDRAKDSPSRNETTEAWCLRFLT